MEEELQRVGEVAGLIYHKLEEEGALTAAQLRRALRKADAEYADQAIGWLAREDKLAYHKKGCSLAVSLKEAA